MLPAFMCGINYGRDWGAARAPGSGRERCCVEIPRKATRRANNMMMCFQLEAKEAFRAVVATDNSRAALPYIN